MRGFILGVSLSVVLLAPNVGTAQVFLLRDTYPQVTAANAAWRLRNDPVFHAGAFYYPTGPSVYFNGDVMRRTGTFEGVPLYEDATLEPYSIVYVPIGGNVMRPYERRREGELAGSVGSRTPSFPIQQGGEVSLQYAPFGLTSSVTPVTPPRIPVEPFVVPESFQFPAPAPVAEIAPPALLNAPAPPPRRTTPAVLDVWVPFDNARYYSSGSAVTYSPDRFVQVGEHHGFPVYRLKNRSANEIYIAAVPGGPIAPYKKR